MALLPAFAAQGDREDLMTIADTIARLPWQSLQPQLLDWLSKPGPEPAKRPSNNWLNGGPSALAELAAYIFAQRPAQIPVEPLVARFAECPPSSRRLLCVLLSKVPPPSPTADAALLRALQDADAGVRWQAALAIYQRGRKDTKTVAALTARLGDTNEYVGAAAAYALGKLGAREATAAVQVRLQARVPNQFISLEESRRQIEAVEGRDRGMSSTFDLLRVDQIHLQPSPPRLPVRNLGTVLFMRHLANLRRVGGLSLNNALLGALAELGGKSDCEELARWLGSINHGAAVAALGKVDARGLQPRLLQPLLDRNADLNLRLDCLDSLAELAAPDIAKALVPLLSETTVAIPAPSQPLLDLQVCDLAALAIARLQGWKFEPRDLMDPSQRGLLVKQARAWAEGQP
jgi:HEAT repeat protein